jgi:hypothetical protein
MSSTVRALRKLALGGLGAALFIATASAQSGAPSEANHFIETPKGWVHPKTAWGDPDLTGIWPIAHGLNLVRSCPRAGGPGGRGSGTSGGVGSDATPCDPDHIPLFKTEAVYQAEVDRAHGIRKSGDNATQALARGDFGAALQGGVTDPTFPERQTSMIVDPPNGKLPELTLEGKRRSALMRSSWSLGPTEEQTWDHWEDFDSWDRCITRGMPTSMMPYRYNNGIHIFQAPGMVVLSLEMIHEDRIVYTDGRAALTSAHAHYMGEPRGRWEGNTLVITTTNYKEGPSGTNIGVFGSPAGNRFPVSRQMKTTERLTRLNDDTILYEMRIEDPVIMARTYTVRYPLRLNNGYEWWEYNCHEGNRTIRDYINASRAERAARAQQPAQPGK